jgi:hypothetical protein
MYRLILAASILLTLNVNAQVLDSLILHYSFDNGTAQDNVGNQSGVINGAISCDDHYGNSDKAFYFSNNAFIKHDTLDFGSLSEASISMWVKPDLSSFVGPSTFMSCGVWGAFMNIFNVDGTAFGNMDGSSSNNSAINVTGQVPTNDWFHFVMTNDGSTTKLYIDGQLENQFSENFLWVNNTYNLFLGVRGYGNGAPTNYFQGKMDDFRIYSKALSLAEIDTLLNLPNPFLSNEKFIPATDDLIIYPNPSNGIYTLENTIGKPGLSWEVYNQEGKLIRTSEKRDLNLIDLRDQPDGLYNLVYSIDGKISQVQKLLKKS